MKTKQETVTNQIKFSMTNIPTKEDIKRMEDKVMEATENLALTADNYCPYVNIFTKRGETHTWKAVLCTNCTQPALLHWKEEGECKEKDKLDRTRSRIYEDLVNNNRLVARDVRKIIFKWSLDKEWLKRNSSNKTSKD